MQKENNHSHFDPFLCVARIKRLVEKPIVPSSDMVYAALETRFAVEASLSLYYKNLIDSGLSKKKKKLYAPKDIIKCIHETEPNFLKKIEFVSIYLPIMGASSSPIVPDLPLLEDAYGKVGNALHASLNVHEQAQSSTFWTELQATVLKAKDHLTQIVDAGFPVVCLNELGMKHFEEFVAGKINQNELREILTTETKQA